MVMLGWLVVLLILVISIIIFPMIKTWEYKQKNNTVKTRFNIQDEVTYENESYVITHLDAEKNYNMLNIDNLNLSKVPISKLDADGILTSDLNNLKEKYGENNE